MNADKKMSEKSEITNLLLDWSNGDGKAVDRLMPLVYEELHSLAEKYMRKERSGHTLQATALVNEAYLRLIDQTRVQWRNKAHFFAIASQTMRRILVDYARHYQSKKRGNGVQTVSIDGVAEFSMEQSDEILAVHEALESLSKVDERRSRVVELRFFGGLSVDETAEVLGIGKNTVVRDWNFARAWIYAQIMN